MRLLVVLSVIAMVGFLHHDHQASTSFTPENDIYVPENSILKSGVTEAEIRQVANQLYDLYATNFSELKRTLVFNIQWSEDKFNAYTN